MRTNRNRVAGGAAVLAIGLSLSLAGCPDEPDPTAPEPVNAAVEQAHGEPQLNVGGDKVKRLRSAQEFEREANRAVEQGEARTQRALDGLEQ